MEPGLKKGEIGRKRVFGIITLEKGRDTASLIEGS